MKLARVQFQPVSLDETRRDTKTFVSPFLLPEYGVKCFTSSPAEMEKDFAFYRVAIPALAENRLSNGWPCARHTTTGKSGTSQNNLPALRRCHNCFFKGSCCTNKDLDQNLDAFQRFRRFRLEDSQCDNFTAKVSFFVTLRIHLAAEHSFLECH